ncbi:MAG: hypothetical protein AAF639_20485 [Chloroflexota bacterium]
MVNRDTKTTHILPENIEHIKNSKMKIPNLFFAALILGCGMVLIYLQFISVSPMDVVQIYYTIAIAGIIFFSVALRFKPAWKVNLMLLTISFGLTVYLCEILLFYLNQAGFIQQDKRAALAARSGMEFDTRSRLEIVNELLAAGTEAYPSIYPMSFLDSNGLISSANQIYPLSGISDVYTVYCNESGAYSFYYSDEYGFNNPKNIINKSSIDILLVGDSFTNGACVEQGQDLGGQLRRQLKKDERTVFNAGFGANGPLLELATLTEYGYPLKPAIVLWVYYEENDLDGLVLEQKSSFLMNYLDPDFRQDLINRQNEIDYQLRDYYDEASEANLQTVPQQDWRRIIRLSNFRQLLGMDVVKSPTPPPSELFQTILVEARDRVQSWGGTMYFVYLPAWQRYAEQLPSNEYNREAVLSLVEQNTVPLIDLHPIFSEHQDPLSLFPFRYFGHYTPEGYELVAQEIEKQIAVKTKP